MLYALLLRFMPRWLVCFLWVLGYSTLLVLIILLANAEDAVFRYMK